MSPNIQQVIDALLQQGAKRKWYEFEDGGEKVRRAAYVCRLASSLETDYFIRENQALLQEESASLFEHWLPRRKRPPKYLHDVWLVLESSIALQMSIVDQFFFDKHVYDHPECYYSSGYREQDSRDPHAFVERDFADKKRVLKLIAGASPFRIRRVGMSVVAVQLPVPVETATLDKFFDAFISHMKKYDRLEESEKSWRSTIKKSGCFYL